MEENDIDYGGVTQKVKELEGQAKTAMLVAKDQEILGVIGVADQIKQDSEDAIAELKEYGLEPVMITGDNERTAKAIADQVGIDRVIAEVMPDQKRDEVMKLQDQGENLAMAFSSINVVTNSNRLKRVDISPDYQT